MKRIFVRLLKVLNLYFFIRKFYIRKQSLQEFKLWKSGKYKGPDPHVIKQKRIKFYAKKYGYKIFVETGTYLGDMIDAVLEDFEVIYSIELSKDLYLNAKKKYLKSSKVRLIQGDSGEKVTSILSEIKQPALFWLDGHFSEGITAKSVLETPVLNELKAILKSNFKHLILIDDARNFGNAKDYPSVQELRQFVRQYCPAAKILIENDCIKIIQY